jgi:hypothetical protein
VSIGLVVEIIGDASKLSGALGKAEGDVGGFASKIGGGALKVAAFAGAAGIAVGAIAELTMAAAADRDEQAKLEAAIQAAGAATGDYNAVVDEAIAKGQERAFSDSQTREAMQSLVTATGDVTLASEQLAIAQDVARFANVDLATAADALAKANAGSDGALRKLIPGLEKGATATDTIANAQAAAAGQADKYAASTQGQMDKSADAFGELAETIGSIFLPILDELLPVVVELIKPIAKIVQALLPAFGAAIRILMIPLRALIGIVSTIVDWLARLIGWISDTIGAIGRFFDSVNPFKDFHLPSLPFSAPSGGGGGTVGRTRGAPAATGTVAAPTIQIFTTGDSIEAEQAVVRALRRVTRINGGVVPALGWANR